jgi:hypothetical protein
MNFTLKIWRQKSRDHQGSFASYAVTDIPPDASILEMLDVLNSDLIRKARSPSRSTTTAEKESAEAAASSSTVARTAPTKAPPHASNGCGISGTARRSPSNPGAQNRFLS